MRASRIQASLAWTAPISLRGKNLPGTTATAQATQPLEHAVGVAPRPVHLSAPWAIRERLVPGQDTLRDPAAHLILVARGEHGVAVQAAGEPALLIRRQAEIGQELGKLLIGLLGRDQTGAWPSEEREPAIASDQDTVLLDRDLAKGTVLGLSEIEGVIPKCAQPPGESAQHGIDYESPWRVQVGFISRTRRHRHHSSPLYPDACCR
jgi:hypothetical protein